MPDPSPVSIVAAGDSARQSAETLASSVIYQRLAEPFPVQFEDVRGGVGITYISGEQVVSRLNEVLGVDGWTFRVLQHEINAEADEAWALGELVAMMGERTVVRQQFGSQKIKRSRSSGAPLDLGFDLKGATTDAMKKCASLLGVGLYLSRKEPPPRPAARQQPRQQQAPAKPAPAAAAKPAAANPAPRKAEPADPRRWDCQECGIDIEAHTFTSGEVWVPARIVEESKLRQDGRVLCYRCLKKAEDAKKSHPAPAAV